MHISLDNKNSIAVRRTVRICFALGGGMGVCSHLWGSSPPNAVLYSARWTSRGTLFISFSDVIIWPLAYRPSIGLHVFSCMLLCASRMASLVILALSLRAFIVLIAFFPRRLFVITVGLGGGIIRNRARVFVLRASSGGSFVRFARCLFIYLHTQVHKRGGTCVRASQNPCSGLRRRVQNYSGF